MKKQRILVDIDDTLVNNCWNKFINEFLGTNYSREEVKTYSVDGYILETEKRLEFLRFINTKQFYEGYTLIKDAKQVLQKLNEVYDVYICSACVLNIGKGLAYTNAYQAKFEIMQKCFPFISPDKFIFTQNKNIINADIIIDDSLFNLHGPIKTKIMFNSFTNSDVTNETLKELNITRVNSWKEIEKMLLQ